MSHVDWFVGMDVVCTEDTTRLSTDVRLFPAMPEKGKVYSISLITTFAGEVGIQLHGVANPIFRNTQGLFPARWFRPVERRQTDISCFTQMLNPSKIKVGEPA